MFLDVTDIDPGARFPKVLNAATRDAKSILACWSKVAFTRLWVIEECRIGLERDVLIPIAISPFDDSDMPEEFRDVNFLSIHEFPLMQPNEDWARAIKRISALVGRELIVALPGGSRKGYQYIRSLGISPLTQQDVTVWQSRHGIYLTDGEVRVPLPRNRMIQNLTIASAAKLLASKRSFRRDMAADELLVSFCVQHEDWRTSNSTGGVYTLETLRVWSDVFSEVQDVDGWESATSLLMKAEKEDLQGPLGISAAAHLTLLAFPEPYPRGHYTVVVHPDGRVEASRYGDLKQRESVLLGTLCRPTGL